ncbi:conopressin/neurophysin-like [Lethenteron reissneri]|uniref:conopressin/neurophysin-like n=1 Tax=Lethenteron reissneri TaxID=7753 RepID=UPI002AB66885|nr:conopressin/neurophysin-like [Lethenteron reissneri]
MCANSMARLLLCLCVCVSLAEPCFIRNCPRGGKRDAGTLRSVTKLCPQPLPGVRPLGGGAVACTARASLLHPCARLRGSSCGETSSLGPRARLGRVAPLRGVGGCALRHPVPHPGPNPCLDRHGVYTPSLCRSVQDRRSHGCRAIGARP